jgi:hypothetical protein
MQGIKRSTHLRDIMDLLIFASVQIKDYKDELTIQTRLGFDFDSGSGFPTDRIFGLNFQHSVLSLTGSTMFIKHSYRINNNIFIICDLNDDWKSLFQNFLRIQIRFTSMNSM